MLINNVLNVLMESTCKKAHVLKVVLQNLNFNWGSVFPKKGVQCMKLKGQMSVLVIVGMGTI